MSEDIKSEQAADNEVDGSAKPEPEAKVVEQGVGDDVENALSEWDADSGSSNEQQTSKPNDKSDDEAAKLRDELRQFREERQQEVYQRDLAKVVQTIRGDFSTDEIDNDHIDIWLNKQAKQDERVARAWLNRDKEPAKFERTIKALTQKFAKDHARFRLRDDDATANREAVAHAVRGGSTKPPEGKALDLSKMSNAEARQAVEKEYGYTPNY